MWLWKEKKTKINAKYRTIFFCHHLFSMFIRLVSSTVGIFCVYEWTINWILFENIFHLSYSTFALPIQVVSFHHCISYVYRLQCTAPLRLLLFVFFSAIDPRVPNGIFHSILSFVHCLSAFHSFIHSHCTDTVTTQHSTIWKGNILSLVAHGYNIQM